MKGANRFVRMLAVLGACLLALGAARAQEVGKPLLLVASPEMKAFYAHTVLVAVPAGESGHLGFILNRATEVTLARLFPQHAPSAKVVDPVFVGGPELAQAIFAVKRSEHHPGADWARLFGDLFVTASAEAVDRTIEQTPNDARYFAGLVVWQPGELDREVGKGFWHVSEPDAGLLFRKDAAGMWEELVKRFGNGAAPSRGMLNASL